jgi:hypothetical protein
MCDVPALKPASATAKRSKFCARSDFDLTHENGCLSLIDVLKGAVYTSEWPFTFNLLEDKDSCINTIF